MSSVPGTKKILYAIQFKNNWEFIDVYVYLCTQLHMQLHTETHTPTHNYPFISFILNRQQVFELPNLVDFRGTFQRNSNQGWPLSGRWMILWEVSSYSSNVKQWLKEKLWFHVCAGCYHFLAPNLLFTLPDNKRSLCKNYFFLPACSALKGVHHRTVRLQKERFSPHGCFLISFLQTHWLLGGMSA